MMRFITPTRPMRAGWTSSGGPISGLIAPQRAATSRAYGGVVTTSTAMTDLPMSPVARHGVETCAGGGHAASGAAGWLGLAAAPTFAIMALWTGLFGGQPDMLCMGMQDASPLNGMVLMYALMSAFH